jgi:hypothetical protein
VNIQYGGEVAPLSLKILREHLFAWNLGGRILAAPHLTTWWVPHNYDEIMRYGHTVNSDIPEDVAQAESPDEPWPERVVIRIKSLAPPQVPAALLSVGGSPLPSAPDSPLGWRGAPLGQAQQISADASGLIGYDSQNQGTENLQMEAPQDPELPRVRGESMINEEVHKLISWTTRKNYMPWVGISLPIQDPVGGEYHEGQLWEEIPEDLIIEEYHAEAVYY